MLNHGCLKRQIINGKFAGPVDTINRHHNIIDITKIGNYYYYLTPAKLFRDTVEVATDIKNLYIQKIYHVQNNLIGLSRTGGLYLFDLDSNVMKGPYLSDVYFYPNAIVLVQDSILEAGTNIGIIRLNPNNLDTIIQNVDVKMFFVTRLKNHILEHMENIIHFGLPAILFLFIIFVVLLVLIAFLAKKRTSLNNEIKNLQNDRKEVVNNLKRDSLLNIPNEDPHSVYFQNYCDQIKPIRDKIREIDMSSPNFQESIKDIKSEITTPSVLRSALNLEIENLNVWYKTNEPFQDTKKLDEFKNRIEAISKNCLENIIGFTKTFKQPTKGKFNNDRKQYYLTTCVLCLFAHQTKNFKIIDNQYLSIILNPICLDAKDENNNKKRRMNYVSGLKKDILNNFDEEGNDSKRKRKRKEGEKPEKKEIFKCKDGTDSEMSELYKEIMEAIKEVLEYNL